LPWAWPKDGARHTLEGAGRSLAEQYQAQGLNMLHEHAQFPDKSVSLEAGVLWMLTRMEAGRFKVFEDLKDFFSEYRLYHRVDGKIRTENDDLLCAVRYGCMSLRYAELRDPPRASRPHYRGKVGPSSWMSS
jgi:Terminase RNaseH-like domain